jgi:hypothetical protein
MESVQITCDVCGRAKGETNHWFKAVVDRTVEVPVGIAFGTSEANAEGTGLVLEHICGEACLHKRLSRWIDAGRDALLNKMIDNSIESVNA